jgi:hypothetical protein
MIAAMQPRLPLHSLLSQVLVAFTIEFDNEFEHQVPHRTSNFGSTPGAIRPPYLLSMVMWLRFLRYVPDDGIPLATLKQAWQGSNKEMKAWLTRMSSWWGYVTIEMEGKAPDGAFLIRPTAGGLKAFQAWRTLTGAIEHRWRKRVGAETLGDLIDSLGTVANHFAAGLPGAMPILGYGLFSAPATSKTDKGENAFPAEVTLPALLARTLLAYTIEFERDSAVSLAISANVLRFFERQRGVLVRELPGLAGVSKEAVAMATGFLEKRGFATVKSQAGSRAKVLELTQRGPQAVGEYVRRSRAIEDRWRGSMGSEPVERLRRALERLAEDSDAMPLHLAIKPYPDGWRAQVPAPAGLPHFPMVLHRGGFPDGS